MRSTRSITSPSFDEGILDKPLHHDAKIIGNSARAPSSTRREAEGLLLDPVMR